MASSSRRSTTPWSPQSFTTATLFPSTNPTSHPITQSYASMQLAQLKGVRQDAGRCKFARYGCQHEHVTHATSLEQDTRVVLQETMLLQEDGRLAAKLDHVSYLLDELLEPFDAPTLHLAQTRSLLELLQMMQDPRVLQTIALSSVSARMKQLLLTRLTTTAGEETARLSLAVVVYFLSHCADAKDCFDHHVLSAIVHALKQELQGEKTERHETTGSSNTQTLRKTCLQRKGPRTPPTVASWTLQTSTMQVMDAMCRLKLDKLLQDHEVFYAGKELHVTVTSALCAALHKLLQQDASHLPHVTPPYEPHSRASTVAFSSRPARLRQLMHTGGLAVLVHELSNQMTCLEPVVLLPRVDDVTVDSTRSMHAMHLILNVLSQATGQVGTVKHYMSQQKNLFAVLLKLVAWLSELSWNVQAHVHWHMAPSRMALALEVLLSAMRVLINLTHHDSQASNHVHALGGMHILVTAFSRQCDVALAEQTGRHSKWSFDACLLLLSGLVNSIEFSEANRDAVAGASLGRLASSGEVKARSACALFVEFFLSKVQSYRHLIDGSEALACAIEEDDWNPEDVILGGSMSLLLGYLMKGSTANGAIILSYMPASSPQLLLRALGVYVAFYSQVGALTPEIVESVLLVENILKACDTSASGADKMDMVGTMAFKSKVTCINVSTTACASSDVHPAAPCARRFNNVCLRLDESDEDTDSCIQDEEKISQGHQIVEPFPLTPGREQSPRMSMIQLSSVSVISETDTCKSSPIAIYPEGSTSSPVVAQILKRTCQLVEEVETTLASASRSSLVEKFSDIDETRAAATEKSASLGMEWTMDVTSCQDDCALSHNIVNTKAKAVVAKGNCIREGRSAMPWKRKKKPTRGTMFPKTPFDCISDTPPRRVKKSKVLLETPTRASRTLDVVRQSPLLNLTPTRSSPVTPVWMRKTSGLLQTPVRNTQVPLQKDTLMSTSQLRRKVKVDHLSPTTRTSSVFDFTD